MKLRTERERSIWSAVFAAQYVADFHNIKATGCGFDRALEVASAETAEHVANTAIEAWRQWDQEGRAR